jgi:hypothetical protein
MLKPQMTGQNSRIRSFEPAIPRNIGKSDESIKLSFCLQPQV